MSQNTRYAYAVDKDGRQCNYRIEQGMVHLRRYGDWGQLLDERFVPLAQMRSKKNTAGFTILVEGN
jgi:hypothetical protein